MWARAEQHPKLRAGRGQGAQPVAGGRSLHSFVFGLWEKELVGWGASLAPHRAITGVGDIQSGHRVAFPASRPWCPMRS